VNSDVRTVRKPGDCLLYKLQEDSADTRIGLSHAALKASRVFSRNSGEFTVDRSDDFRRIVSSAADIHNWKDETQQGSTTPPLAVYAQQTIVNVKQA
jgi:hypothetical protein